MYCHLLCQTWNCFHEIHEICGMESRLSSVIDHLTFQEHEHSDTGDFTRISRMKH